MHNEVIVVHGCLVTAEGVFIIETLTSIILCAFLHAMFDTREIICGPCFFTDIQGIVEVTHAAHIFSLVPSILERIRYGRNFRATTLVITFAAGAIAIKCLELAARKSWLVRKNTVAGSVQA